MPSKKTVKKATRERRERRRIQEERRRERAIFERVNIDPEEPLINDIDDEDVRNAFNNQQEVERERAIFERAGINPEEPIMDNVNDEDISELYRNKYGENKGGKKTKKHTWSKKYKASINCKKPKGFSQKQYCKYGRNKSNKRK